MSVRRTTRRTLLAGAAGIAAGLTTAACRLPMMASGRAPAPQLAAGRTVAGYVTYWDQRRGFAVAREHRAMFDQISPMWYSLDPQGGVVLADDEHTTLAPAEVRSLQADGVTVLPTVTSLRNGDWKPDLVADLLADPGATARHVDAIVRLVVDNGYDGADIDYEGLSAAEREPYARFVTVLGERLRAAGKLLVSAVYPKQAEPGPEPHNQAQDYAAIGAACDQVRLMTYDFHYAGSEPGPGAPVGWVRDCARFAASVIPREKLALGVVLLGYDWAEGRDGETIGWSAATGLTREHDLTVTRDRDRTPHFRYLDMDGTEHEVWFEDAESSARRVAVAEELDLGAVFFWRLGGEDPRTWDLVPAHS